MDRNNKETVESALRKRLAAEQQRLAGARDAVSEVGAAWDWVSSTAADIRAREAEEAAELLADAIERRREAKKTEIDTTTGNLEQPATIWFHGEQSYSIDGKTPKAVSREQHNILKEFTDRDVALTTEALKNAVSNVSRVMKNLDVEFPGAVRRPAAKGDGYYIRVRTVATE